MPGRGLNNQITSVVALALLVQGAAGAAPAPVVDTRSTSGVSNVSREQLERLPTGRRLEDLIRTCPSTTIPTVSRRPDVLIDGQPTVDINCVQPADIEMIEVYKAHNGVRAEYGAPPLAWDPQLVQGAQDYANQLARTGELVHASREGRGTVRENISQGLPGWNASQLMGSWLKERPFFRPGIFPNVSTTGDWYKVGHYSQMIWPTTTVIGCARASGMGSTWMACRYDPGGNKDGKPVGIPPIIAQGGPPVININNPPPLQPANAPPPQQANAPQPQPVCDVADPDDLGRLIAEAAVKSGFAPDSTDPRDTPTDRQWDRALQHEKEVQNRIVKELAKVQGDVARNINAYLAATSTFQERYSYLASSTTGLQGLLTNWYESRAIYEKADLAFALMNLGVGVGKLGFKAYRFLAARRATATVETAATAGRTGEAATAALSETQAFNRTLVPPGTTTPTGRAIPGRGDVRINVGAEPNAPGFRGYTGASSAAGKVTNTGAFDAALQAARQKLAEARAARQGFAAEIAQYEIDNLVKMGPAGYDAWQGHRTAAAFGEIDAGIVKLAREAGVNAEKVAIGASVAEKEWALLKAIAQARGWHDIPTWAGTPITNILLQARKILGGVREARISAQDLELLKSLKTYVESQGLNFAQYLRTAAGEVAGGVVAGETKPITEIIKYYDDADIDLLLKVLETGGDASALRNAVGPVTQASLNGLARAGISTPGALGQAGHGACGTLETGARLTQLSGTGQGVVAPGGRPTDAQLGNVMSGLGDLGQVGLSNVLDEFGVTDRFTAGQSYGRAVVGELWELITSPSTTVASFYYTNEAQTELLNLLQNEQGKLVELGTSLDSASRALADLQNTLQRAGLSGPGSYLGNRGPADLRGALDELERTYNSGSDDWKRRHKDQIDERRNHITQKLQDLAETVSDLNALASRVGLVRSWLDSLRLGPDGKLRGPVEVFNPMTFVRLGSISLYLRGIAADLFGLTTDVPFHVTVPQTPLQPRPASAPVEDFDSYMQRMRERSAQLDAAAETEVDPDFDKWLESLNNGE